MIINHKYKFIFFKTKKTGGTSMEVALSKFCQDNDTITSEFTVNKLGNFKNRNIGLSHMTASDLHKVRFNPLFEGKDFFQPYFKFTIIREPIDTFISHFFHLYSTKRVGYIKGNYKDNIDKETIEKRGLTLPPNINDWIKQLKENKDILRDISTSNHDIYSINGTPCVDDFITYSRDSGPGSKMYEDCSRISNKLNLPENLADLFFTSRYKTTSRVRDKVYLTQESLNFIEEISRKEREATGMKLARKEYGMEKVII